MQKTHSPLYSQSFCLKNSDKKYKNPLVHWFSLSIFLLASFILCLNLPLLSVVFVLNYLLIKLSMLKIIPRRIRLLLSRFLTFCRKNLYLQIFRGWSYFCPFCFHSFYKFFPAGSRAEILKEKGVIGGGYRFNVACPFCSSTDRERLVYLFLQEKSLIFSHMRILHVAPEKNIQIIFQGASIEYFSVDICSPLAQFKMDIQSLEFPDNYFDAIICNHVLEHIVDDKKAMSELFRVLRPGSWAILQVPYSPFLEETFEDFSIVDERKREEVFGQSDHVRIYGLDYVKRLQDVGFQVRQEKLSKDVYSRFALNPKESIFFCRK